MNEREALKMALEALTNAYWPTESDLMPAHNIKECAEAITAIREALAQPEQEPVAWALYQRNRLLSFWMDKGDAYDFEFTSEHRWEPLYTSPPPQRTWVGLTDEEAMQICVDCGCMSEDWLTLLDAIEAKLKEKNT